LPASPPRRADQPWFLRVFTDSILDNSLVKLSDRAFRVLMVLDARAATDPFCFPGNDWIVKKTGKKDATLREIFIELETEGWLRRVFTGPDKRERVGFLFLKRIDPEVSPSVENSAKGIEYATSSMLAKIASLDAGNPATGDRVTPENRRQRRRKSSVIDSGNPATHDAGFPAAYKDSSGKKTQSRKAASAAGPPPPQILSSTSSGEEGKTATATINVEELGRVAALVAEVYGSDVEAIRPRVENLAARYPLGWIGRAAEDVAEVSKREKVGWGLLLKILGDYAREGGPPPKRKAKVVPERQYHVAPPRPKPSSPPIATSTAEEGEPAPFMYMGETVCKMMRECAREKGEPVPEMVLRSEEKRAKEKAEHRAKLALPNP
jgi:hypothetical protein